TTVILAGAIPAAALALIVDGVLLWVERSLARRRRSRGRAGLALGAAAVAVIVLGSAAAARRSSGAIVVGSKDFTEQLIVGGLVSQALERDAGMRVERRLNLGGPLICERALASGDIDLYVEYTGTALTAVFHQPVQNDPAAVLTTVRDFYARS